MNKEEFDRIFSNIPEAKIHSEEKYIANVSEILKITQQAKKIGEILVKQNKLTQEELDVALQGNRGGRIGEMLVENRMIDNVDLARALAEQLNLPFYSSLPVHEIDPLLVQNLSIGFCTQHMLVPVSSDEFSVTIAVADPLDMTAIDDLRVLLSTNIKRIVCPRDLIEAAITNVFERQDLTSQDKNLEDDEEGDIEGLDDTHDLLYNSEEAPVRKEVSSIIRRGISEKASDIHIEPYDDKVVVRFRVDGRLREIKSIPKKFQSSVATRIKILAKLNIAESRLPQDGRISLRVGSRDIDVRVSTLPIKYGERIVLRILDKSSGLPELGKIGMPVELHKQFENLIQQKHGIVLVTGPTGSGKTTTLASAIQFINRPDVSIITVEDPVEVQIPGVSQVEVNERAGLTFAAALRSILRQNPNIILIGEIRDAETAQIAVQAAMTGHLVFSTLHTNDTAASVTRLTDLGVEQFQITTTVLGILAVRLMRKVCTGCRELYKPKEEEFKLLNISKESTIGKSFYRARKMGCMVCKGSGYSGRMGIYELLMFDDPVRNYVLKSADGASLKKYCVQRGMKTLRDSAAERFLNGETTFEEAIYATQSEYQNDADIVDEVV